jgi:hypothetical protein
LIAYVFCFHFKHTNVKWQYWCQWQIIHLMTSLLKIPTMWSSRKWAKLAWNLYFAKVLTTLIWLILFWSYNDHSFIVEITQATVYAHASEGTFISKTVSTVAMDDWLHFGIALITCHLWTGKTKIGPELLKSIKIY